MKILNLLLVSLFLTSCSTINNNSKTELLSFDENPMGENGYMTVNKANIFDGANDFNTISFDDLDDNREFTVYVNFRNKQEGVIKNARHYIDFNKSGSENNLKIKGYLVGDNAKKIEDFVTIVDLPQTGWNIRFLDGSIRVDDRKGSKGTLCSEEFPNLNIPYYSEIKDLYEVKIGDLPYDSHKGWCSQGYVFLKFTIDDKSKLK